MLDSRPLLLPSPSAIIGASRTLMIDPLVVEKLILIALEEDIGFADLTTEIVIPKAARAQLVLNARTAMVIAGIDIAGQIFRRRVPDCDYQTRVEDGDHVAAGTALAEEGCFVPMSDWQPREALRAKLDEVGAL